MKKCPSCQDEVEDSLLRCHRCGAPLQKKEEGNSPFLSHDVSSLNPAVPSGVGREKMPREKKLLVGSLVAGSLGIVLAIVALAISGLPAAVFSGGVGPSFPHTASWLPSSGPRRVPKKSKTSSPSLFPRLGSWLEASPFCSAFCYS